MHTHRSKLQKLVTAALLAAAVTIMTAFICHIPIGVSGGYIHFGDAIIYLAATLLPLPYAAAVGAIGGGMADLLTSPAWAPATVLIKMLIVLPFTSRGDHFLCRRNVAAVFVSGLITIVGYYLADGILFGGWAALVISVTGNLVQAAGSAAIYLVLAAALDKVGLKRRLLAPTSV
ncbi:MAG: TIGR04002 family protein [Intestinimonas sp.]|jgi:uncharacterized repeat protein (TIGR04002 family)|nr:TIGR04002 family protein [Intestinimonas sp.]